MLEKHIAEIHSYCCMQIHGFIFISVFHCVFHQTSVDRLLNYLWVFANILSAAVGLGPILGYTCAKLSFGYTLRVQLEQKTAPVISNREEFNNEN